MQYILYAILLSFFEVYPDESASTINDFRENHATICAELNGLTQTERVMALSIVAPEYSLFSKYLDFMELRTLYVMYLNAGVSDFSVGPFQMKPSFIEELEKTVKSSQNLSSEFSALLPQGSEREQRRFRLEKLSTWSGQLQYLKLFVIIADRLSKDVEFADEQSKLRYWATLYNSGLSLTPEKVGNLQKRNLFPKRINRFNYSAISCEFFSKLREFDW